MAPEAPKKVCTIHVDGLSKTTAGYNSEMAGKVLLTILILGVVLTCIGYYINSRIAESNSLLPIRSLSQFENLSATECRYAAGTYGSGSGGYLYIYSSKVRISVADLDLPDFSGSMQAVIGTDGTRLIDPESAQAAGGTAAAAVVLNTLITQAPWQCSPWWLPDTTMFNIPNAETF